MLCQLRRPASVAVSLRRTGLPPALTCASDRELWADELASDASGFVSVHGVSAVFFFLCIAYVCWFRARNTLPLVSGRARVTRAHYRALYRGIGVALAVSPLAAIAVAFATRKAGEPPSFIFWIEALGVWTFAFYWGLKTVELARSDADALAAEGRLGSPPSEGGPSR